MKFLKYFFGTLAALYAAAQAFRLVSLFISGGLDFSNAYTMGMVFGGFAGMVFGVAIAIFCFRPKKN